MADIDPITREAMRRANFMQGRQTHSQRPAQHQETHRESGAQHSKESETPEAPPAPLKETNPNGGLESLFKNKETSVILILIILLMGESGTEHLLLALMYLLI